MSINGMYNVIINPTATPIYYFLNGQEFTGLSGENHYKIDSSDLFTFKKYYLVKHLNSKRNLHWYEDEIIFGLGIKC